MWCQSALASSWFVTPISWKDVFGSTDPAVGNFPVNSKNPIFVILSPIFVFTVSATVIAYLALACTATYVIDPIADGNKSFAPAIPTPYH